MKRLAYALLLCLLPACVIGCGGGGTTAPAPPDTSNVGTWRGTYSYVNTSVNPVQTEDSGTAEFEITVPVTIEQYDGTLKQNGTNAITTVSLPPGDSWTILKPDGSLHSYTEGNLAHKSAGVIRPVNAPRRLIINLRGGVREYRIDCRYARPCIDLLHRGRNTRGECCPYEIP